MLRLEACQLNGSGNDECCSILAQSQHALLASYFFVSHFILHFLMNFTFQKEQKPIDFEKQPSQFHAKFSRANPIVSARQISYSGNHGIRLPGKNVLFNVKSISDLKRFQSNCRWSIGCDPYNHRNIQCTIPEL